ncbi:MAG TPA: OmpA family protein [Kofleriaceae bacterium]|nr:OmpA family protein [Kofleriaceae bacterium]
MRWFFVPAFVLAMLVAPRIAAAQPVSFAVQADVPLGQKPAIRIKAVQSVSEIRLELDREDGKHFATRHGVLAKGQTVTMAIGDGAPGKASYKGTLSMQVAGASDRWSQELTLETLVRAPVKVTYDADHLDLDKHELQFKLSRPAGSAELSVIGEDGKPLGTGSATYQSEPADKWLAITWTQPADTRVMMLKLRVVATDGVATNVELVPWSVVVDHEDVNFSTDSAVIEPTEAPKLDASAAKIKDIVKRSSKFMKMKLYIAGHTDTVGPNAKNRKLSLDRAVAIGSYLRKHGIAIPIVVAGFGEEVLKVKTKDNTDERANRRADYVIGPASGAPPFKGPYLKVHADWKQLR